MGCDAVRAALSAAVDGEEPGIPAELLEHHLQRCPSCRRFGNDLIALHRRMRLRVATSVPDLTPEIMRLLEAAEPPRSANWRLLPHQVTAARLALVVIAFSQALVAMPALLTGRGTDLATSGARHLAVFALAYAATLFVVAWHPDRARALFPVVTIIALGLALVSVINVMQGSATLLTEFQHLFDLVGLSLVWALARSDWGRDFRNTGIVMP